MYKLLSSCLLGIALVTLLPTSTVYAQDDFVDEVQTSHQIVILDVPQDGTLTVAKAIAELGEKVSLYPQTWFAERIDEMGFAADGILDRRVELSALMDEYNIDVILFTQYSSSRELYRVTFIPRDAKQEPKTFDLESPDGEGMSRGNAVIIRKRLVSYFESSSEKPDETPTDLPDPNALREEALKNKEKEKDAGPKGIAEITAGFRLIEPTIIIITADSEQIDSLAITLGSAPGFALQADLFPMKFSEDQEPAAQAFGLSLNYSQVFKKLNLRPSAGVAPDAADVIPTPVGLSFLDFEISAFYNLAVTQGAQVASIRPKGTFRLQRFASSQDVLEFQSFRIISLALGLDAIFPLGSTGASLLSSVELAPFSNLAPLPNEDIGTMRYAYTTSGMLGLAYNFLPNVGARFTYSFDHTRLLFEKFTPDPANPTAQTSPKGTFSASGILLGVTYIY